MNDLKGGSSEASFRRTFQDQGPNVAWKLFLEGNPAPRIEEIIWLFHQGNIKSNIKPLIRAHLLSQELTNDQLVRVIEKPASAEDEEPTLRVCCERLCNSANAQKELETLICEGKPLPKYEQLRLMLAEAYLRNCRSILGEIVVRSRDHAPDSLHALEAIQSEFPQLITPEIKSVIRELRMRREWTHAFRNALCP